MAATSATRSWNRVGPTTRRIATTSPYDVTKAIVQGNNALGVLLGNGMYNVPPSSRYAKFTGSFGSPKLILRLQMEFSDGSKDAVASDTSWTATGRPDHFHPASTAAKTSTLGKNRRLGQGRLCRNLVEAGHSGQRNCAFTDRAGPHRL